MNTSFFKTIKNLSQSGLLILAAVLTNPSHAELLNPQVLLKQVTNATFERIELDQQSIQSDPNHLRDIIEQELMPHVDHRFAAFKVLGSQFRSVPKDKIPEFVSEFKQYLVSNFAVALASYGGQELLFEPVKNAEGQRSMSIKAIIRQADRPDINISFKLRKSNKTQEWKTYDLVAEGISLLSSKRSEFASIIRQQGIQAVIDVMKNKNNQPLIIASNIN
ncbi:MAG: phospholipid transport system substrate-binding protein [Paraglaciecola sp.]|jgi:phospholipid transport system substrate-binding protein